MSGTYNRKDTLYQQAKENGYRSRAAYKLLELDKKYKLLTSGAAVVDLGCFPGGWLQVAAEKLGASGKVVGVDLVSVEKLPALPGKSEPVILQGDFLSPQTQEAITTALGTKADVVLSDMSPKLSGIRFRDVAAATALVEQGFLFCSSILKQGGVYVAKVFPGNDTDDLVKRIRPSFEKVQREQLRSSRKTSNEFYLLCRGYCGKQVDEETGPLPPQFTEWSPL